MTILKCPRCELNYILDGASLCTICQRETKGETAKEALELCPVCNENPTMPGKDVCLFCLKEIDVAAAAKVQTDDDDTPANPLAIEDSGDIDEIDLSVGEEAPDPEMDEIGRELSLEDVLAEENQDEDAENEQEDGM